MESLATYLAVWGAFIGETILVLWVHISVSIALFQKFLNQTTDRLLGERSHGGGVLRSIVLIGLSFMFLAAGIIVNPRYSIIFVGLHLATIFLEVVFWFITGTKIAFSGLFCYLQIGILAFQVYVYGPACMGLLAYTSSPFSVKTQLAIVLGGILIYLAFRLAFETYRRTSLTTSTSMEPHGANKNARLLGPELHSSPEVNSPDINDELLDDLSKLIAECWDSVGVHLHVQAHAISNIRENNVQLPSRDKKAYRMLEVWRDKKVHAPRQKLANVLRRVSGKNELADELLQPCPDLTRFIIGP